MSPSFGSSSLAVKLLKALMFMMKETSQTACGALDLRRKTPLTSQIEVHSVQHFVSALFPTSPFSCSLIGGREGL